MSYVPPFLHGDGEQTFAIQNKNLEEILFSDTYYLCIGIEYHSIDLYKNNYMSYPLLYKHRHLNMVCLRMHLVFLSSK
jgi:hypothetical protein